MTISEAINKIDALKPNNFSIEDKIGWLSTLDFTVKREMIDTHEGADEEEAIEVYIKSNVEAHEKAVEKYAKRNGVSIEEARKKVGFTEITYKDAEEHIRTTRHDIFFNGYNEKTDLDTELLAPAPYDEMYIRWLEARIDYANGEFGKYNNSLTAYNDASVLYARYYNRNHMPKGNKFKFF